MSTNLSKEEIDKLHHSEVVELISDIGVNDESHLQTIIENIDKEIIGDVLVELSEAKLKIALSFLNNETIKEAIEELETDDATDLIQNIEILDKKKAQTILESLDKEDKEDINWLKQYEEDEAGAFMQTELFSAYSHETIQEAKERLIEQKSKKELENIYVLFVVNQKEELEAVIPLEDLFVASYDTKLSEFIEYEKYTPRTATSRDNILDVAKVVSDYDLPVIPVVEYRNRLIGRITSDDVYDIINDSATEQIYHLAGLGESADYDSFFDNFKDRLAWLCVNLATAILASFVISFFDDTLRSVIALAILMPIVASMGGNAGTQTITVIVRQLALGQIKFENTKTVLKKEFLLSLLNGCVFALLIGIIAYIWFADIKLSLVIGGAMILNIITSGIFGALIPMVLKRIDIDPAIASTVIITTVTDVVGFLSFLLFAQYFLL